MPNPVERREPYTPPVPPTARPPIPILITIVGVLFLAVALVGGVIVSGHGVDAASTPLLTSVLGFVSVALMSLIGMLNASRAVQNITANAHHVNTELADIKNGALTGVMDKANVRQTVGDAPGIADQLARLERIEILLNRLEGPTGHNTVYTTGD